MRSYPFLVGFFQIGELNLSLGVSEPRHILEVTDLVSGVVAGSLERKEQLLEAVFGTMRSRQGIDCHVATWPRRDVPRSDVTTSGQQCRSQRMGTSRRHHVATSPRRDVNSKICTSSFKVRMARK